MSASDPARSETGAASPHRASSPGETSASPRARPGADAHTAAEQRATKLTLMALFFGILGTFSLRAVHRDRDLQLSPFDLLLLGLASFRTGRMIAYERVAQPLRAPFTVTKPDDTGAGETVVAVERGSGVRRAIGELVSCPICVGTWVAAGLVYGLHLLPRPTRVYLAVMSTTGVAEVLYELNEALTWLAEAARKRSAE